MSEDIEKLEKHGRVEAGGREFGKESRFVPEMGKKGLLFQLLCEMYKTKPEAQAETNMIWSALSSKPDQTDEARRAQLTGLLRPLVMPAGIFAATEADKAKLVQLVDRVIGILDLKPVPAKPIPPKEPSPF